MIDETTQAKLETETLAEVVAALWPGDCQTCGGSLGDGPCALVVDAMISRAYASLHHPRHSEPRWNDGIHVMGSGALLTWSATPFSTSFDLGDRTEYITGMVVNPALEVLELEQHDGKWQLRTLTNFRDLGFEPPGDKVPIGVPVRRSRLTLTPTSIAVTVGGALHNYGAPANLNFISLALKSRGILLIATHAIDPKVLDEEAMDSILSSRHTVVGWVPLYEGQQS
jgi:hypothetical protein